MAKKKAEEKQQLEEFKGTIEVISSGKSKHLPKGKKIKVNYEQYTLFSKLGYID
jgi:FKBP-type peptidyl-prolyl cis-trans isomerase